MTLSPSEVNAWYGERSAQGLYGRSFEHDFAVANTRLDAYKLSPGVRLLDVGCGKNGAFVAAARARGLDAWGQDILTSSDSEFVYGGQSLEDVAFPTDDFDVVTIHDVLEHALDPAAMLREVARVLRPRGRLILDFPRFHHEAGVHHWKPVEHLWMFNEEQLRRVLKPCFQVATITNPIPSKVVITARPRNVSRPQILVPPGIGDSLWSITKLPGFLKHHGLGFPDVWVHDSGGPRRTQPFLRTLNILNAPGYKVASGRGPEFQEAYAKDGRTVFKGLADTEYFISYNGVMGVGKALEDVDPEYGCVWRPKMHLSKEALAMKAKMQKDGPYILAYWNDSGMYRHWMTEFPVEMVIASMLRMERELGMRIVFLGAPWDKEFLGNRIAAVSTTWENLIGDTSFDQMCGAMLGAAAVVGMPAGNTILSTVFNVPTVLLWNKFFHVDFWKNACPAGGPYTALDTKGLTPQSLTDEIRAVMERRI